MKVPKILKIINKIPIFKLTTAFDLVLIPQDLIDAIDGTGARYRTLLNGGGTHGWRHDGMMLVVLCGCCGHHSSTESYKFNRLWHLLSRFSFRFETFLVLIEFIFQCLVDRALNLFILLFDYCH